MLLDEVQLPEVLRRVCPEAGVPESAGKDVSTAVFLMAPVLLENLAALPRSFVALTPSTTNLFKDAEVVTYSEWVASVIALQPVGTVAVLAVTELVQRYHW